MSKYELPMSQCMLKNSNDTVNVDVIKNLHVLYTKVIKSSSFTASEIQVMIIYSV